LHKINYSLEGEVRVNKKCLILSIVLVFSSLQAHARPLGKEALLFENIPKVVTASRQVVTVLESPATATIITRQDIVHSGYNSVTQLLRYVAGVDFFKTTGAGFNIGMRGVNGLHANNVLILVDGRPIYSPVRNTNQCALIPEVPDDIERIEVIRGPGSVLYGSNAFSGVINIITRSPEAINGIQITGSAGTFSDELYSLTAGKRFGNWSYKLVSAWTQKNSTADHDKQIKGLWKMSGELNYEKMPGNNYNLSFGFAKGKLLVVPARPVTPFDQDGFDGFLRSRMNWDDLKLDLWWRHFDNSGDAMPSSKLHWRFDHIDMLLQNQYILGDHTVIGGIEGRVCSLGATTYDKWHNQFIGSVFGEDHWKLTHRLDVFTGLRMDYQTEAHAALSPRLSIVYSLLHNQSIRFTASQAFKYPSYLQNYIDMNVPGFEHQGNQGLDPERLSSMELAYQMVNPSRLSLSASIFYNYYDNIIDLDYTAKNQGVYITYENLYDIYQYGGEIGFQYRYSLNLLLRGNYSYVWKQKKDGITFGPVPTNQINGEFRYDFDLGLWVDMRIHWQDHSDYSIGLLAPLSWETYGSPGDFQDITPLPGEWQELSGFTLADLSMGFISPDRKWNIAAAVHNLFHSTHQETPDGNDAGTTFTARLSLMF